MADRSADRASELAEALLAGRRSQVRALLESGVAARFGPLSDPYLVDLLVMAGADVDAPTGLGDPPIETAAALGRTAVVKRLLANGATVTDQALAAARRRNWTGIERLLTEQLRDGDLTDGLSAEALAGAAVGAIRIVGPDRVVGVAFDAVLVEWVVGGGRSRPSRWFDLDVNQVTWLEPSGVDDHRLLVAGEDEGVIEVDLATFSVTGERPGTDGRGPGDRAGVRQVVASASHRLVVPARRSSPWVMQVARVGVDQVIVLREGPTTGENPTLELGWLPAGVVNLDSFERTWVVPGVQCLVPAALAVVEGLVALHLLPASTEPQVAIVDPAGPELLDLVTIGGPTRSLPGLQTVVALSDGQFLVIDDGDLVVVERGHEPRRVRMSGQAAAVDAAYDLVAVGATAGLEVPDPRSR